MDFQAILLYLFKQFNEKIKSSLNGDCQLILVLNHSQICKVCVFIEK